MGQVKKVPMRKCIGCQEMKNKKEMMRVLKTPEGEIVIDLTGRKNGRGAYLCFSKECLEKSMKNKDWTLLEDNNSCIGLREFKRGD